MIFTGFKRKSNQIFFNKKVSELLNKPTETGSNLIKTVLIILDDASEKELIEKDVQDIVGISKNKLETILYQEKPQKLQKENSLQAAIISPNDFGWFGAVKSEKAKHILTKKYDLLINYSKVDALYSNLLLLQSNIKFKVGFAHLNNRFYDLLIDCKPDNVHLFNQELKKYLRILKMIE